MKRLLLTLIILIGITNTKAQTYVSGGIYSNTTWTKAASPYIVTDTVVVFPGVTLTIEPGVTVKFDSSMYLEIRDAKLIAEGTITDTITFTSSLLSPKVGSWEFIKLHNSSINAKLDYCKLEYSRLGLYCYSVDTIKKNLHLAHSTFRNNEYGVIVVYWTNTLVDNCSFINNTRYGIEVNTGVGLTSINNTKFIGNKYGLNGPFGFTLFNCSFRENEYGGSLFAAQLDSCSFIKNYYGISTSVCIVKNCIIDSNIEIGINSGEIDTIYNSIFTNNKIGLAPFYGNRSYLFNNTFKNNIAAVSKRFDLYNGIAIKKNTFEFNDTGISGMGRLNLIEQNIIENNLVGLAQFDTFNVIKCNKICNNSVYNFCQNTSENIDVINNDWCTKDSALIRSKLFDGYVDVRYGLINFMPIDTSSCYLGLSINESKQSAKSSINLYPNPFTQTATLEYENPQNRNHQLSVFNTMGQLVMKLENIKGNKVLIDRKELQAGLYFYQLRNEDGLVGSGKMIIE